MRRKTATSVVTEFVRTHVEQSLQRIETQIGLRGLTDCGLRGALRWDLMESENPQRNSGDSATAARDYGAHLHHLLPEIQPPTPAGVSRPTSKSMSSYHSDVDSESESVLPHQQLGSSDGQPSRSYSPTASEGTSASSKGVPGSARWLRERNEALEAERLALVKQTLEVRFRVRSVNVLSCLPS